VHYCGSGCACQISAVFPVNIQTCATNCEGAAGFMHYLIDCRCCASPLVTGDPD
jgi:hypothetical protein